LHRHLRLRQRADFAQLRKAGVTWRHPALMISTIPNQLAHNRYGFIISKRVGSAVTRNRLRRRLRACLHHWDALLQPGHDILFITRPACAALGYHHLCDTVGDLLRRAGFLKDIQP